MHQVQVRHGCYDAVKCGSLDHHECGSPDACPAVKTSGVVCTFGTMTQTTFHEKADIDAEIDDLTEKHAEQFPDDVASTVNGKHTLKAGAKSALRVRVHQGKNIHTPAAEKSVRDGGRKHGTDNRALHDSNPAVFGH